MTTGALAALDWLRGVETFAGWAWRASWQGAALAVVVGVLLWAAGKRISPGWRFGLWGLVLVRLAMPAVVEVGWMNAGSEKREVRSGKREVVIAKIEKPVGNELIVGSENLKVVNGATPVVAIAPGHANEVTPAQIGVSRWERVVAIWKNASRYLAGVWLLGILWLVLRINWSTIRLARAVARMQPITDSRVLLALKECCGELGLSRIPQPRELPGNGAPALVGFLWPRILLPTHVLQTMAGDELHLILLHELAHIKRRDVLINWLATIVCVIHWFNPAAWLVAWRMRVERELACDELVLRMGRDRGGATYARTIVKLVEALSSGGEWRGRVPARLPGGAVGILEGKAQIQRRLLMIARFDAKGRRWPAVAAGLGFLIGAVALSGVTKAAEKKPDKTVEGSSATTSGEESKPRDPSADDKAVKKGVEYVAKFVAQGADEQKTNARTAEKLKKPIPRVEFAGQGLSDVLDLFRDTAGIDIMVEWGALEANGITRDAPVTLNLREPTPLDAVLSLMFRSMGSMLQFEIDKGVVVISPTQRNGAAIMRVYDVSDLVSATSKVVSGGGGDSSGGHANTGAAGSGSPVGGAEGGGTVGAGAGGLGGGGFGGGGPATHNPEMDQLIALITTTVQPEAWTQSGGNGASIGVFKTKLVIKGGENIHKEVEGLIDALRDRPAGKSGKGGAK